MENINEQQLIDQHKDSEPLYALESGEEVVGHAVDDNNKLLYIIRSGDEHRVGYALDENPVYTIPQMQPRVVKTITLNAESSISPQTDVEQT